MRSLRSAAKGTPVWDRCLLHIMETVLIDFPVNWIRVALDSSDAMIVGALKSFWYV